MLAQIYCEWNEREICQVPDSQSAPLPACNHRRSATRRRGLSRATAVPRPRGALLVPHRRKDVNLASTAAAAQGAGGIPAREQCRGQVRHTFAQPGQGRAGPPAAAARPDTVCAALAAAAVTLLPEQFRLPTATKRFLTEHPTALMFLISSRHCSKRGLGRTSDHQETTSSPDKLSPAIRDLATAAGEASSLPPSLPGQGGTALSQAASPVKAQTFLLRFPTSSNRSLLNPNRTRCCCHTESTSGRSCPVSLLLACRVPALGVTNPSTARCSGKALQTSSRKMVPAMKTFWAEVRYSCPALHSCSRPALSLLPAQAHSAVCCSR